MKSKTKYYYLIFKGNTSKKKNNFHINEILKRKDRNSHIKMNEILKLYKMILSDLSSSSKQSFITFIKIYNLCRTYR